MAFDPVAEAAALREDTRIRRKKIYRRRVSRLDKFRYELVSMTAEGIRPAELQRWLKTKRVDCHLTTIIRFLEKHQAS